MSVENTHKIVERAVRDPEYRTLLSNDAAQALEGYELTGEEIAALKRLTPATFHALVRQLVGDMLFESGMLDAEALQAWRRETAEELRADHKEQGAAVSLREPGATKNEFQGGVEIDCENRVHLCKASCCKLRVQLSMEDVQEAIVRWELAQHFFISPKADGHCAHLDRERLGCTVYAHRPIICRGYDCRKDKRIWLDFENRVVNPLLDDPDWPEVRQETKNDE